MGEKKLTGIKENNNNNNIKSLFKRTKNEFYYLTRLNFYFISNIKNKTKLLMMFSNKF
jgi:hypothetical protein